MSRSRTYKFLLQPTSRQLAAIEHLREPQRELYNAALEERRGSWKWNRRSVSSFDQTKERTQLRSVRPDVLRPLGLRASALPTPPWGLSRTRG